MEELRVLSPTAILGYGFPIESFEKAIQKKPHVIAVDAGSSDPGPFYLGSGKSFTDYEAVKRDLEIIVRAGVKSKIPVIIGTVGGSGANSHLDWGLKILEEINEEQHMKMKVAVIKAEFDKEFLLHELKDNKINKLYSSQEELTHEDILDATRIVGQMGVEPFIEALEQGADVILAGRAYDPAMFAALPIQLGFDKGLALHLGKILECASIAATPGSGSDCMMGYLSDKAFYVEPLNENRKCTTESVAAHTLYEKENPYVLPGPGGLLDLHETKFTQISDRRVKVEGSKFVTATKDTIKLEGAKRIGNRTISIAGIRDPILIDELEDVIEEIKNMVDKNFKEKEWKYSLNFIKYGKNGVLGELEPQCNYVPHEIGLVIEAVGQTQEIADTICSFARSSFLHFGYENRMATAGNLAFPFSPSDFRGEDVYQFNIYHLIEVDSAENLFPITYYNWE